MVVVYEKWAVVLIQLEGEVAGRRWKKWHM